MMKKFVGVRNLNSEHMKQEREIIGNGQIDHLDVLRMMKEPLDLGLEVSEISHRMTAVQHQKIHTQGDEDVEVVSSNAMFLAGNVVH